MKEIKLSINGMVCTGCENRVKNALKTLEEVDNVEANYENGSVIISATKDLDKSKIIKKIEDLGFEIVKED